MGKREALEQTAALIRAQRWAALATLGEDGASQASMVAYAPEAGFGGFLLHLSRLAEHTRNLLARPSASLVISEADHGSGDPQQLARLSVGGRVTPLEFNSAGFETAKVLYLGRLPDAAMRFEFPDFVLFRLVPEQGRFVGGFARAFSLDAADLRKAASLS